MRQSIITKYHGPTDSMGARISVRSQAGRRYYAWDHALDVNDNHYAAAKTYAESMGWLGKGGSYVLMGGGLPDGTGNAYVIVDTRFLLPY